MKHDFSKLTQENNKLLGHPVQAAADASEALQKAADQFTQQIQPQPDVSDKPKNLVDMAYLSSYAHKIDE